MYNALPLLGAALCHEAGHIICARYLGLKIRRVGFNWRGLYVVRQQGSAVQNLAVSVSGPVVNLVLAGTMILGPWFGAGAVTFGLCNLAVGLYNLLPIPCSDGRRILILLTNVESPIEALNRTNGDAPSAFDTRRGEFKETTRRPVLLVMRQRGAVASLASLTASATAEQMK